MAEERPVWKGTGHRLRHRTRGVSPRGVGKRAGRYSATRRGRLGYGRHHLVATGNAHHYSHFDKTPAYIAAESSAKEKKLGLWAAENPINPYDTTAGNFDII